MAVEQTVEVLLSVEGYHSEVGTAEELLVVE